MPWVEKGSKGNEYSVWVEPAKPKPPLSGKASQKPGAATASIGYIPGRAPVSLTGKTAPGARPSPQAPIASTVRPPEPAVPSTYASGIAANLAARQQAGLAQYLASERAGVTTAQQSAAAQQAAGLTPAGAATASIGTIPVTPRISGRGGALPVTQTALPRIGTTSVATGGRGDIAYQTYGEQARAAAARVPVTGGRG